MDIKQEVHEILARLQRQGFQVGSEELTEARCTAKVEVERIPFDLIAGKLSAIGHYAMPPLMLFPLYLQSAISKLRELGYSLRVAKFKSEGGGPDLYLEVVLQLWEGGGAILSLRLTGDQSNNSEGVKPFLSALGTTTVTLPEGSSISLRGYASLGKIQEAIKTSLGPRYSYVLVRRAPGEWMVYLPCASITTTQEVVRLARISAGVTGYAEIELRIPAHQE